jgi:DNA primase
MAFPPRFLDELRARLTLSSLVGRRVRLIKRGREFSGLCPFHNEKSPSFTVSDEKDFFHCFGCGAHGDAIEFVRRSDGLSFPEAVERLAQEVGLAIPEMAPGAREEAERHATLQEVMEACAGWFESQLAGAAGASARRYLETRGLSAETIARFRLGYAPGGQQALKQAMLARQITETALVETGMLIKPDDAESQDEAGRGPSGRATYDRFRDRIMFPITDRRGRVIAFGGRALGDIKPKYLNSPDTPLFHKGQVLYNLALAREAARETGQLIVAEGYMDVIAVAQAGFGHAVAPLGTALTEEQLELLWKLVPEPILCFDGDGAGLRAAARAAERCLPLLKPGLSLRFALLPSGEDPDSLVKSQGKGAMQDVLAAAAPLAEVLWRQEFGRGPLDTPERRAALQQNLAEIGRRIIDETVRNHYRQWFRDRLNQAFENRPKLPSRGAFSRPGGYGKPISPFSTADPGRADIGPMRGPQLAHPGAKRERLLIAIILNHPSLLRRHEEAFAHLDLASPELDRLRTAILDEATRNPDLDSGDLARHLTAIGFADILSRVAGRKATDLHWFARSDAAPEDAEKGWNQAIQRHHRLARLRADFSMAEAALAENMTDETFRRFLALSQELASGEGDEAELDGFGVASGREAAI